MIARSAIIALSVPVVVLVPLTGCNVGSSAERQTGRNIQFTSLSVRDRTTFINKGTYYVRFVLDASRDDVIEQSTRGQLISDDHFESIGERVGDVLGVFVDRQTKCQLDLLLTESSERTVVTAGIVC